ncbi:MAG: hypothetical protein ACOYIK_08960 [Coriobacteriales bacterium]|jgi:Fe-S-cluster-containing dehydrogenase component
MVNGLLIDQEYCSGCHSCEISCRNEHDLPLDQWGIKVGEVGPFVVDKEADKFIWNYYPQVTALCDTCVDRRLRGEKAACELHCLTDAITVGPIDELYKKMEERGSMMSLLIP